MSSISALSASGVTSANLAKPDYTTPSSTASTVQPKAVVPQGSIFPSPTFALDPNSDKVLIEFRNSADGAITQQIPPKSASDAYQSSASPPPANLATNSSAA
jgi:hypothetical protein